jgi:hypothetical protein
MNILGKLMCNVWRYDHSVPVICDDFSPPMLFKTVLMSISIICCRAARMAG